MRGKKGKRGGGKEGGGKGYRTKQEDLVDLPVLLMGDQCADS